MHATRIAVLRWVLVSSYLSLPLGASGCGGGQAETGEQIAPELRQNLEESLNASEAGAKEQAKQQAAKRGFP
jgi:hypothetical protein